MKFSQITVVHKCTCKCVSPFIIQEGPHSALNEDEFYDALEMAYQEDELEVVIDLACLLYCLF